jgi:plastocyanin
MRKVLLTLAALAAALLLNSMSASAANSPAQIVNCTATTPWCFSPNPIRITVGSTVTWTNTTAPTHTSTSNTGVWDTGSIGSGQTSSAIAFNTPGTFAYHCSFHPGMTGSVIVSAASVSPAPTSPPVRRLASGGGGPVLPVGAGLVLIGLTLLATSRLRRRPN